jgi:hypothetical protein
MRWVEDLVTARRIEFPKDGKGTEPSNKQLYYFYVVLVEAALTLRGSLRLISNAHYSGQQVSAALVVAM